MRAASQLLIALCFIPTIAFAQGAALSFGALKQDTSQPVQITADSLTVNQTDGTAVFEGNVMAIQGEMRLGAARIEVMYQDGGTGIETLRALGGVTVVSATDAAESSEALYTIATGDLVMTGDVLLTQGQNTITGERLVVDLKAGTGRMEGRVQTVFTPGTKPGIKN